MSRLPKQSVGINRYSVRIPGYARKKDIGFGDVIKRATAAVGFQPCVGCERRAAALNQWLVFSSDRRPK